MWPTFFPGFVFCTVLSFKRDTSLSTRERWDLTPPPPPLEKLGTTTFFPIDITAAYPTPSHPHIPTPNYLLLHRIWRYVIYIWCIRSCTLFEHGFTKYLGGYKTHRYLIVIWNFVGLKAVICSLVPRRHWRILFQNEGCIRQIRHRSRCPVAVWYRMTADFCN